MNMMMPGPGPGLTGHTRDHWQEFTIIDAFVRKDIITQ